MRGAPERDRVQDLPDDRCQHQGRARRIALRDARPLRRRDRASAILVGQAIGMLIEAGPELGRPLADRIAHSRLSNRLLV